MNKLKGYKYTNLTIEEEKKAIKRFIVKLICVVLLLLITQNTIAQKISDYENKEGVLKVKISQKKNTGQ